MRIIKTLICAAAAAVALTISASSAKAISFLGVVTNYDVLNVSLTVKTNIVKENSTGFVISTASVKLVNKDVLNILQGADFYGAAFPPGAKLVVGWDAGWDGDILVVDETGTNVLYDADSGGNNGKSYFYVNFYNDEGSFTGSLGETDPGHFNINWANSGDFGLYDNANKNLYLWGGASAAKSSYVQNWDKNHDYTTWSSSESYSPSAGDQLLNNNNESFGSISGTINSSGHGKGMPAYLIDQTPF